MDVFNVIPLLCLFGFVTANPYLDVHLKAHAPQFACADTDRCNISYSVVLLHSNNHHNLQELSALRKTRDETYEEHTVVGLSRSVRRSHGKIFTGIQLYDLPENTQDFYLVDVTNTIRLGERAKILVTSEDFSLAASVHRRQESAMLQRRFVSGLGCSCVKQNCGCCEHVTIKPIHLDHNVCTNITYVSEDIGIKFSLSVDNHIYYSEELSVRNPPPVCFDVPHLRQFAALCIKFYDMQPSKTHINGCAELEAHLYHVKLARVKLGCFTIPI
ncbi:hypothetical protein L596_007946 [Steinernema carpocapsae]|uniref:DUF4773 domain-containing protein n=1 Tax=Steinernema carpocapsae TaxID=34508 RepID=A0A4U5PB18_STECR|nr:hypothetical protein L596_007946 [Steinernema carpocapsae]